MVQGPNFERLFNPKFSDSCPPQALESLASPVAYLIELLRWIELRIESASSSVEKLPLHDRRKDLKPLSVDFKAVHQSVSAVDIIVPVLETFITEHNPQVDLEQAMIESRYPNGLPYYQHWVTLDAVARHHGLSVGNFAHMVDLAFPYFLQEQAWDDDAGRALAHASRLGPYQRQLLTEPAPAFDDREAFYWQNFGSDTLTLQNLNQVPYFGERTKLDTPGLEALLSVRGFAPVRSANAEYPTAVPEEPESGRSGSVYLNANTHPAISVAGGTNNGSFLHRLSVNPLVVTGLGQLDRMNRKLRLDQWLELPSEQVDALLVAAIKAEVRSSELKLAGLWNITEKVVHALGLFQSLRERYGCTAHDFAVFIDELSIYGRGEAPSQFDQVFNSQDDYRQPLVLDNGLFPVVPEEGVADLTVTQLCSALGIDLKMYAYLAPVIADAHGLTEKLPRNAAIMSSFYRMVKLPRLLGITPMEGVLMLVLLGGQPWLKGLAGVPRISSTQVETPDVLNLIYAMHSCVGWCADRKLPVLWVLQQVSQPQALAASDADLQLFEQVRNLLPGALFTNSALLKDGVPPLAGASWLDLLMTLVDSDGLVMAQAGTEADYLAHARKELDQAVRDGLGEKYELERPAIVEKMLTVLLQARDAQVSMVKECLAVYAGVDAEQAFQVLVWANATVYQLLRQVLERVLPDPDEPVRGRNEQPDPLLELLANVRRCSAVVVKLELDAELLQDYLNYGHKAWLDQDDRHAFTVRTLYYLTSLTRAFELSEQPAQKLLDYLREVNALPSQLTGDALLLARQAASIRLAEFFDWSVQEVRECVSRIDPTLKILKNLTQLDLFMRIRVLAAHTGMDALTIFLVGTLPEDVEKTAYKVAAERALLSLSESGTPLVAFSEDLKQLVNLTCVVDNTDVVANKPGAHITFTVTLKDAGGNPLSGVDVHWRATLGSIATQATDVYGKVEAQFIPGKVTGTDTPLFWLNLFEPMYAPTIDVVADAFTLQFPPPLMSQVPLGAVAYGQEVELYATLMDRYTNLAKNSLVRWSFEVVEPGVETPSLIIRPAQGYTNQEGVTRVFVSSPTGGTFRISVWSESGESSSDFESIIFDGKER
jgi:hypothetical protein